MSPQTPLQNEPSDGPALIQFSETLEFDPDDIDGGLYMLDRDFGGTLAIPFSEAMDPTVVGTVRIDGHPVDFVIKQADFGHVKPWMLGIKLIGRLRGYNTQHTLHVEGFTDVRGLTMAPQDLAVSTKKRPELQPAHTEHDALARRVAEEGTVLLENQDATLPLGAGQLNIFGHALHAFRTAVVGAGKINPRYTIGLAEAIRRSGTFTLNEELATFYQADTNKLPAADVVRRARAASDTALVVLSRGSGENTDNSSAPGEYRLTEEEERLIAVVGRTFARTVVILNTPYPIDMAFVDCNNVHAVVLAPAGGMLAGPALLNVLDGTVNPSGKLPNTWARQYEDIPASRNFYDCGVDGPRHTGNADVWIDTVYEEGIYVGYRYFSTFGVDPAYPFGHGLSYTTFRLDAGTFVPASDAPDTLRGTVTVTNTGSTVGREVVQVYLSKPDGELEQPSLELVDFAKTRLLATAESEQLTFHISPETWASWDESRAAYVAPAGEYVLRVGTSSVETVEVTRFTLHEPRIVRQSQHVMRPPRPIAVLSQRDPQGTFPRGTDSGVQTISEIAPVRSLAAPVVPARAREATAGPITFGDVQTDPALATTFVAQLSVEQLARLVVCGQDGWGMEGTGVAGIVAQPDGLDIPLVQAADGNSGVNVRTPNIGMPATVVLAATFDRRLAREVGRVIGEEAVTLGVDIILAPALNLHRNPLNGRHPEYFSEDPLLSGVLAGHYAAGLESTGVSACYKHLAGNNAESARKRNHSLIPERALRELYLRTFEIAMRTHQAQTVMTAYNALNGAHTAADPELIRGWLRHEVGFTGLVMTDWSSYDTVDVVDMVLAGNNWITPGGHDDTYTQLLIDAVAAGRLPVDALRESATHVVRLVAAVAQNRSGRDH